MKRILIEMIVDDGEVAEIVERFENSSPLSWSLADATEKRRVGSMSGLRMTGMAFEQAR